MQELNWERINELFDAAIDLDPEEQSKLLDRECASEPEHRRMIEQMIAADAKPPAILGAELSDLATLLPEGMDGLPSQIGPYHVVKPIGHGGMGIVVLAERPDLPRKVALKLLRDRWLGPDTVRRFKREQRVLAGLQHPHIALLLDAGTSDDGIPFLAMEYIDGETLTEYAETHQLNLEGRLALFEDVCEAVQFAHQSLVVHRDLKPSNILVDQAGQIKLLDFGISKLLENDDDEIITQTAQRMMTPSYASPEQLRGEMVSTSTDVYSLGVVLYELLAGRRPYNVDIKSPTEALRIVNEEMPQRPSSVAPSQATQRSLRGDLDNIVLKALQKEPAERYASVEAFVADVRRYLDGHPVEAREAGLSYRFSKFARRHRWGVGVGAGVLTLLIGFAVAMSLQQAETARERDRAEQETAKAERTVEFLMGLFQANDPSIALGDSVTARELLARGVEQAEFLSDQPLLQAETFDVVGRVYESLGQSEESVELLKKAVELRRAYLPEHDPDIAESLRHLSHALAALRQVEEAKKTAEEALELDLAARTPPDPSIARSLNVLGLAVETSGEYADADSLFQMAYDQMDLTLGRDHSETVAILSNRVSVLLKTSNYELAETLAREIVEWCKANLPPNHPRRAEAVDHLAVSLRNQNKFEEARPFYEETLFIKRKVLGNAHPSTAGSAMNLGIFFGVQGDYAAAEPYFREAVSILEAAFGPDSPRTASAISSYAILLGRMGRYSESAGLYRRALAIQEKAFGIEHPDASSSLYNLGITLGNLRRYDESLPILEQTTRLYRASLGEEHSRYLEALSVLGLYESAAGHKVDAELHTREAYELSLRYAGEDNTKTILALAYYGRALVANGEYARADSILTRARQAFLEHAAPNHPSAVAMADALGRARSNLGAYTEADSLLRAAYAVRLDRLGLDHPWTIETEQHLVELYENWGRPIPDGLVRGQ